MRDPLVVFEDQPAGLLDDHLILARRCPPSALPATAVRTRSVAARPLLARAALGDAGDLAGLLDAARAGDRRWLRRLRRQVWPALLAGLAQTIALQDVLATDQRDALALYELIRTALGAAVLPPGHQGLHTRLAFVAGEPAVTRMLLRRYPSIRPQVRAELRADLLNPFVGPPGRAPEPWLRAFRELLPGPGPALDATGPTPFDRLSAPPVEPVEGPHRVSVIVTTYRPDAGLLTAVRSIVEQSWRNVEVVVVDDASGERYTPVLRDCLALGERIRLVRLASNVGTYAARNAGLDVCAGEFVAFQDSDDWSHPHRLAWQVRPLLADPHLVASTSDGAAVSAELLLTRPSLRSSRFNPSSLLFRRDAVMRRLGYFDPVRKGADSEFIGRIRAAYGERALHHVDAGPLALIRLTEDSLSRGEIRPFWMHPARVAYCSAYLLWHERVAAGEADPHRPRTGDPRVFAAPEHLRTAAGASGDDSGFDVVYVADWRFLEGTHVAALDELRALADAGLRVALVHVESYRAVLRRRLPLAHQVQQLLNDGAVRQVFLCDAVEVALVVVRQAAVLQFPPEQRCDLRVHRVLVVADRAPARSDGTDRRYVPQLCDRAARRMFGAEPLWCPQDTGVRAMLRDLLPAEQLTDFDLPHVVSPGPWAGHRDDPGPCAQRRDDPWPWAGHRDDPGPWAQRRDAGTAPSPVVGTDLCDGGAWPADVGDALAVFRRLDGADIRVRLPDLPSAGPHRPPGSWLMYAASDLDGPSFLHQLDVYLHFPHPAMPETSSVPALAAAARGCVVLMPERFAAAHGDAAVYCTPAEVPALVARFRDDAGLFAGQSRTAAAVVARAHHPRLFADRIGVLVRGARAPTQRTADAVVP